MQTTEVLREARPRRRTAPRAGPPTTSFCTSPCRLTAASPSVSSIRRSISGSSSASSARPANSAVRWVGSSGSTSACRVAGGNRWVRRARRPPERARRSGPTVPRTAAICPARRPGRPRARRARSPPARSPAAAGRRRRRPGRAPAARPTTAAPTRGGRARPGRRRRRCRPAASSSADGRGRSSVEHPRAAAGCPAPVIADPHSDRRELTAPYAAAERAPRRPGRRRRRRPPSGRAAASSASATASTTDSASAASPATAASRPPLAGGRGPARRRAASAAGGPASSDPVDVGAGAVDLVHEQHGGHTDPPQRPPDHHGLRLDALDRRTARAPRRRARRGSARPPR